MSRSPGGARRFGVILLIVVVASVLVGRFGAPSDLWDQTQPKTVAYTLDIIEHGDWLLPTHLGVTPATKPPLFNWLAVPFVRAVGPHVDLAHKAPSVLALLASVGLLIAAGRWLRRPDLGVLAGIFFTANYTIFKLAGLARPDMLLTALLLGAWMLATAAFLRADDRRVSPWTISPLACGFWCIVALAWMTKGPAALVVVIYAFVGARVVTGRWGGANRLGWAWGLPLSTGVFVAWLASVWSVNPDHLRDNLIGAQIVERMAGGPESGGGGMWRWIRTLPNLPLYFIVRFAPWSILAILGAIGVRQREKAGEPIDPAISRGASAAVVYAVIVIAFYTLSAGKRADYIASIFGPAALLAAWQWAVWTRDQPVARWTWPGAVAIVSVAIMTVVDLRPLTSIRPDFARAVETFNHDVRRRIAADPAPIIFADWGSSELPTRLGVTRPIGPDGIPDLATEGVPFWLIGSFPPGFPGPDAAVAGLSRPDLIIEEVVAPDPMFARAADAGFDTGVPDRLALYAVRPATPADPSIFKADR